MSMFSDLAFPGSSCMQAMTKVKTRLSFYVFSFLIGFFQVFPVYRNLQHHSVDGVLLVRMPKSKNKYFLKKRSWNLRYCLLKSDELFVYKNEVKYIYFSLYLETNQSLSFSERKRPKCRKGLLEFAKGKKRENSSKN